jgi:hypothetical protein
VRRLAGWLRIGDYPGITPYRWNELWKSLLAGEEQHIERPVYGPPSQRFHDHKGFNWKVLARLMRPYFEIKQTIASPISALPAELASQVWFVARKRTAT